MISIDLYSLTSILAVHAMQSKSLNFRVPFNTDIAFSIDYAIQNKLTPFISMQNHHNLLYREEEREMFPTMKVC